MSESLETSKHQQADYDTISQASYQPPTPELEVDSQLDKEVQEARYRGVGQQVISQMLKIKHAYSDRADKDSFRWRGAYLDQESVATRTADSNEIEEIYNITAMHSPDSKAGRGPQYTYSAQMMDYPEPGSETTIFVDENKNLVRFEPNQEDDGYQKSIDKGTTQVYVTDEHGERRSLKGEDKDSAVLEFNSRSEVALHRHSERSQDQKDAANADALTKLEGQLYGGKKTTTSLE